MAKKAMNQKDILYQIGRMKQILADFHIYNDNDYGLNSVSLRTYWYTKGKLQAFKEVYGQDGL